MGRWRNYVVSKMHWQVFRRREPNSKQNHLEEKTMSELQAHLSDIGSIRDLQAQRATEAQAQAQKENKPTKGKKA